MHRYQNVGIQIDAPEELIEGPDEEVSPSASAEASESGQESPEMHAAGQAPAGPIES